GFTQHSARRNRQSCKIDLTSQESRAIPRKREAARIQTCFEIVTASKIVEVVQGLIAMVNSVGWIGKLASKSPNSCNTDPRTERINSIDVENFTNQLQPKFI